MKTIGELKNGNENGLWGIFHDSGLIMQEEEWKNGKLWNISDYTNIFGDTLYSGSLKNGDGLKINYYITGKKEIECEFKDGIPDGSWTYYYENGSVAEKGQFSKGQKHEEWEFYYKNSRLESKGKFKDGVKDGVWTYYGRDGIILDEVDETVGDQ